MPRKVRLQYPGAIYHVLNRGDRRENIFTDTEDRQRFLQTLGEACQKTGWQVHEWGIPEDSVAGRQVFADLKARRKGDARKVELAAAIRFGTTMPLAFRG